jgi:hypothetical protein
MGTTWLTHINCVRINAGLIFGPGFEQQWFATKYKRGDVEELQRLSGAYATETGKKNHILPPILFPSGSGNKKDIFLNPALVRVSFLLTAIRYMVY